MTVSRETSRRLESYQALIRQWNPRINLVAPATLADLAQRHIDDCLQVAELAGDPRGTWVDLGSGGGLPGLVIAIALADRDLVVTMIESDRRKAAFLRTVIRETGLENAKVLSERIESLSPLKAAYVSARALAPLPQLMAYLDLHLARAGRAFLMKGRQWRAEVEEARMAWDFDLAVHPSRTQDGAAILEVSGVAHAAA